MATQPITCPYLVDEGFRFYNGNLVLDNGQTNNPPVYLPMDDIELKVDTFARNRAILRVSSCFLLSQSDIANVDGYVDFIAIKAIFPANIVESKKYITWEYQGITNYMGELMILSGKMLSSTDSTFEGWNLAKPGTTFNNGGITFCNPHTDIEIRLEILIGY
jgi:hypothetical protein